MSELDKITTQGSVWELMQKMVQEVAELTERNKILQEQNTSLLSQLETFEMIWK